MVVQFVYDRLRPAIDRALAVLLALAALAALYTLADHLAVPWREGRYGGDMGNYFTLGRGILNGLVPYRDLFETKPPGIFWLAALSLWLTGGDNLYLGAQAVAVVGVPLALVLLAFRESHHRQWPWRLNVCLFAWVAGVALALYMLRRGNGYQTESYGAFFAVLYLVAVTWDRERMSHVRTVLAAIYLLGSFGMKEPFLIAALASALLVAPDWRFFVRAFLIPLALAVVMGTVLMALLGYLGPYLHIYLPEIMSGRLRTARTYMFADMGGQKFSARYPLWLRLLASGELFQNLTYDAPTPLLGAFLALQLAATPVYKSPGLSWRWAVWSVLTVGVVLFTMHRLYLMSQLLEALHFGWPLSDPFFRQLCGVQLLLIVASVGCFALLAAKQGALCIRVLVTITAASLLGLAVAVGGDYFPQHYLFAIPGYVAILFLMLRAVSSSRVDHAAATAAWIASALLCLPLILWLPPSATPTVSLATQAHDRQWQQTVADQVDDLLDACGWQRYLLLEERDNPLTYLYPATRHSPFDTGYTQTRATDDSPNLQFRRQFLTDLASTPLVITHLRDPHQVQDADVRAIILNHFDNVPPPCARMSVPLADARIVLLFRNRQP